MQPRPRGASSQRMTSQNATFTFGASKHLSFNDVVTFRGLLPPIRVPLGRLRRIFCASSCTRGCRLLSSSASAIGPLTKPSHSAATTLCHNASIATCPVLRQSATQRRACELGMPGSWLRPIQMQICAVQLGFNNTRRTVGHSSHSTCLECCTAIRPRLTSAQKRFATLASCMLGGRHGDSCWLKVNRVGASIVLWVSNCYTIRLQQSAGTAADRLCCIDMSITPLNSL